MPTVDGGGQFKAMEIVGCPTCGANQWHRVGEDIPQCDVCLFGPKVRPLEGDALEASLKAEAEKAAKAEAKKADGKPEDVHATG